MAESAVTSYISGYTTSSVYGYDSFGQRNTEQHDDNDWHLRTSYDGFTLNAVKEQVANAGNNPVAERRGLSTSYGYLGKPYDGITNLYNYGYRDYSSSIARFTTVDPIRDGNNWYTYVQNDPVNYVDLWGLCQSDNANMTVSYTKNLLFMIMRDTTSYDISTNRNNMKNSYRDSAYLLNKKTGELVYFDKVQSVANYPSTDANGNPVTSTFNDTVASGSFGLKVFTETNVASGVAGVIVNATTIDGRTIDNNGNTQDPLSEGRGLVHSNGNPAGTGDYNYPRSKQCIILPEEDSEVLFDTLKDWKIQDDSVIPGVIFEGRFRKDPSRYDSKGNYK